MNIGQAAKLAGLTVKTVRYYTEIGIIKASKDSHTGYRKFTDQHVAELQFIAKARQFDFSIDECRELLSLYQDKNRPSKEVKALTVEKIAAIDKKLQTLKSLRQQLSYLAANCHGDDRPHCPILEALAKSS
ncbi:MAG TPA: Cu(I)-responsive transcriptional regulator [Oceanospirillaceae bacterium]|nr:Cu(I)-responsive transcriptional regulator [Oceanospirillaceae bacterium]